MLTSRIRLVRTGLCKLWYETGFRPGLCQDRSRMDIRVRPLEEQEIDEADRIMRLAFGTFLKMPDPMQMFGDATFTKRWYADPGGALAAEADGRLIGSNFA